ncbi:MAG: hypothetical protein L6V93_06885 [Clostridiales bacterium]|nr:MAG: hypothetical protein L6V93_06885 [Clostridiales bacterium]
MYAGDRARKDTLVDFRFSVCRRHTTTDRLISKNLRGMINQVIFRVGNTGRLRKGTFRKTYANRLSARRDFLDPEVIVRPISGQIDDLISEIHEVTKKTSVCS